MCLFVLAHTFAIFFEIQTLLPACLHGQSLVLFYLCLPLSQQQQHVCLSARTGRMQMESSGRCVAHCSKHRVDPARRTAPALVVYRPDYAIANKPPHVTVVDDECISSRRSNTAWMSPVSRVTKARGAPSRPSPTSLEDAVCHVCASKATAGSALLVCEGCGLHVHEPCIGLPCGSLTAGATGDIR